MRESIHRLTAMPKPPCARKAHHFDGLVTWETSKRTGELAPDFQYRASSIWRRVTRNMIAEAISHCKGYTPDHIHHVVEWVRANSFAIQPDQTAEIVKTAFKQAFGCMTEGCVTHADTALDVDHVNPAYNAENLAKLVRNCCCRCCHCYNRSPVTHLLGRWTRSEPTAQACFDKDCLV